MHDCVADESLFCACEIHSPWLRGSGPRTGPIWPYIFGGRKLNACLLCPRIPHTKYSLTGPNIYGLWYQGNHQGLWAS